MSDDPWKAQLEALGALLRAQRKAADLTLRDLAERTKVSNAYLSQLERGLHEPSLGVLTAIASALGVPLGSLLTRAGVLEGGEGDAESRLRETEAAILRQLGAVQADVPHAGRERAEPPRRSASAEAAALRLDEREADRR